MTQESTAALLDAAIFTLQRARQELEGPAAQSAPETKDGAIARFVRRYDELDASDYTPAEQAEAYEQSAGVLRRRAARVGGPVEAQAESETRARYFEARAKHKREGSPISWALRTHNEHLGYVDALRRELGDLVDVVQQVSRDEVQGFCSVLAMPMPLEVATTTYEAFLEVLGALLAILGVARDEAGLTFATYRKVAAGPAAPPMDPLPPSSPSTEPTSPASNGAIAPS